MIREILTYSVSSLFWGILAAAGCMVLFAVVVKGWRRDALPTPATYAVAALLGLLLIYNGTMAIGAIKLKSHVDSARQLLEATMEETSRGDVGEIFDQAFGETVGGQISGTLQAICPDISTFRSVSDSLDRYILKKCLWSAVFLAVGIAIGIMTMGNGVTSGRGGTHGNRISGRRPSSRCRTVARR